ncbi:MFS transporter [Nguyenibacter vanlangensis]|uniref:MFS transporter n=1 Tax=Nguyenibacter vanlangensis TaxID=1216886 RepID=A0ABZ3D2T9_9PROT
MTPSFPAAPPASRLLPPRLRRRRNATVALLMAAGCISYVDRAALSVGGTTIMADMHMSYTGMGWLLSVFAWAYLVCQIPAGLVADRLDARRLLGASLVLWSCAQIAFGLVGGIPGLFVCRAFLGLGEAPLFLAGTRALVRWFRPQERGGPIGLFNGSAALGPALAPPALVSVMLLWGWRGMSVAVGSVSLVLAAAWMLHYRDPADMRLSAADRQALAVPDHEPPAAPAAVLRDDLGVLLRQRATWVVAAGYVGVIYLTWLYATWMPAWLQTVHHLTAGRADMLSALPQFFGFAGCVSGGALSDHLAARGMRPLDASRRPLVWAMLAASAATVLAAVHAGLAVSVALMALALFAGGIAMTCGWTLGTIIVAEHRVATLEAIQNTGGSLGGALAPAITGMLADRFGSFSPSLIVAGLVGVACAAIYQFGLRDGDVAARDAARRPFATHA